ncbi:MAG: Wzt carbohydrate-binding domain-containing protein [Gallionella sp.]|nr:Wzt carbohydrate-binding domain-containing protein [Gallionella sp.]
MRNGEGRKSLKGKQVFSGRVIFDHIPKTAGTAIHDWLTRTLGVGCVSPQLNGLHRDLIRDYGGEYSVILAHIGFHTAGLDPRYQYVSCIREPIDRAISWLFFALKNNGPEDLPAGVHAKVAGYLAHGSQDTADPVLYPYISNCCVNHFSSIVSSEPRSDEKKLADALLAIEQYDVWGLYEEMPLFLADFVAKFKLPTDEGICRINVTKSRPVVRECSPLLLNDLKKLNALDLEFYRILRERLQRKRGKKSLRSIFFRPKLSPWTPYNPEKYRSFSAPEFTLISDGLNGSQSLTEGQTVVFFAEFSLSRPVAELNIGISILDENGRLAFGTNTTLLGQPLLHMERGTYRVQYSLVTNLPQGCYTLGFACLEHLPEGDRELAWYDNCATFRISTLRPVPGIGYVSLPTKIHCRSIGSEAFELVEDGAGELFCESVPESLTTDKLFELTVSLVNSSGQVWMSSKCHPVNLSYHWMDLLGNTVVFDGKRTSVPHVSPGEAVFAHMSILTPKVPGNYRLVLVPVQENSCWFDEIGFKPGLMEVVITSCVPS